MESGSEESRINSVVVTNEIIKGKWNAVKNCYSHCPLKFLCLIDEYTLSTLFTNSGKFADVLSVSNYEHARTKPM